MLNSLKIVTIILIIFCFFSYANALDPQFEGYEYYIGDFNGDGFSNDVYIHDKETFILIHDSVSIPIYIPGKNGVVFFEGENRTYASSEPYTLYRSQLSQYESRTYDSLGMTFVDVDGDGAVDSTYFVPVVPSNLRFVHLSDGRYNIKWNEVENVAIYELHKEQSNGTWSEIYVGESLNYYIGALNIGSHTMKVRACSNALIEESCSGFSAEVNVQVSQSPDTGFGEAIDPSNDSLDSSIYWGSLFGEHSVNPDGSFGYSLSLEVPPGINGMEPELALSYNSNARNGFYGWGWTLVGVPDPITRCPADFVRDGYRSGVNPGDSYKFCWGGERLVEVSDKQYRLENESFARITMTSGTSSNPRTWEVETPDGRAIRFGMNLERRTDDQGNFTVWYATRIIDVNGNYMDFYYDEPFLAALHRLSRIEYTKNGAAQSSRQKVEITYEGRPDPYETYSSGVQNLIDLRVSGINTYSNEQLVKQYILAYENYDGNQYADPNKTSRITHITECGKSASNCKSALNFRWNPLTSAGISANSNQSDFSLSEHEDIADEHYAVNFHEDGYDSEEAPVGYQTLRYGAVRGDFDGDNKVEIAYMECFEGNTCLHYVEMSETSEPVQFAQSVFSDIVTLIKDYRSSKASSHQEIPYADRYRGGVMDINGDGLDDYYISSPYDSAGIQFYISNGTTLTYSNSYSIASSELASYFSISLESTYQFLWAFHYSFEDINGDGLLDFVKVPPVNDNIDDDNILLYGVHSTGEDGLYIAMNNGDGFDDFTRWASMEDYKTSLHAPDCRFGSRRFLDCGTVSERVALPKFVDVNGDDQLDILGFLPGEKIEVGINTGTRFEYHNDWGFTAPAFPDHQPDNEHDDYACPKENGNDTVHAWHFVHRLFRFGDVNGDSLTDIVYIKDDGIYVSLSTGTRFSTPKKWSSELDYEKVICGDYIKSFDYKFDRGASDFYRELYGQPEWSLMDVNQDGRADIYVKTYQSGTPGSGTYNNDYEVLFSNGNSQIANGFTNPILIFREDFYGRVDKNGTNLTALEINENGYPYIMHGYRRLAGPPINLDMRLRQYRIYEWGSYKVGLEPHRIESVIQNDAVIDIDYDSINRNSAIYQQTALNLSSSANSRVVTQAQNTAGAFSYDVADLDGLSYPLKQQKSSRSLSNVAVVVTSKVEARFKGRLQSRLNYKYVNHRRNNAGYGDLGFERIITTETISGYDEKLVTEDKYLQEIGSNGRYVLNEKFQTTNCVAQGEVDFYGCVHPSGYSYTKLISNNLKNWKIKEYLDDIDAGSDSPHYFPYVVADVTKNYEIGDSSNIPINTIVTSVASQDATVSTNQCPLVLPLNSADRTSNATQVDGYGNPYQVIEHRCDSYSVSGSYVKNTNISNDTDNWCLGLIRDPITTRWYYDSDSGELSSTQLHNSYQFEDCNIKTETREPNNSNNAIWLKRDYVYDDYGYEQSIIETVKDFSNDGIDFTSRTNETNISYATDGTRTTVLINAAGHRETEVANASFGLTTQLTDANGIVNTYTYDEFGRPKTAVENGVRKDAYYRSCSSCFAYSDDETWYVQEKTQGSSAVRTFYDDLDREVGSRIRGLNGDYTYTRSLYNDRGGLWKTSLPFRNRSFHLIDDTTYIYDVLGRPIETQYPNGGVQTSSYTSEDAAVKVVITDSLGYANTKKLDAYNRVKSITDANGGIVKFWHDELGNVDRVRVADENNNNGIEYSLDYDKLNRKTRLVDPDIGTINYTYNALGHRVTQKNSENELICFNFDSLDRQIRRQDSVTSSTACGGSIHEWFYDRAGELGKLHTVAGEDTTNQNYTEEFFYNDRLLLDKKAVVIRGNRFELSYDYDTFNRPKNKYFPTGYAIKNVYNQYGYLANIDNKNHGYPLWSALSDDSFGNLTDIDYSNGVNVVSVYDSETGLLDTREATLNGQEIQKHDYDFDTEGNLVRRWDNRTSATINQGFCYDNVNRLRTITTNSACGTSSQSQFSYDIHGNLLSNVGVTNYNYQHNNVLTHAVRSTNRGTYQYDNAGRITSGPGYVVDYTLLGKPAYFGYNNGLQTQIVYGSTQKRILREDIENGRLTITLYIDKDYEVVLDGDREHRHYLGDWGVHILKESEDKEYDVFFTRDHIGSVVTKTDSFDSNFPVIKYQAHEPWGKRQEGSWGGRVYEKINNAGYYTKDGFVANSGKRDDIAFATDRGFTNHEHLDPVGLIHMNGRVYDPVIGRFITPDPFIQDPLNAQSYNRYSYVLNNPLRYVDPTGNHTEEVIITGHQWESAFDMWGIGGDYGQTDGAPCPCEIGKILQQLINQNIQLPKTDTPLPFEIMAYLLLFQTNGGLLWGAVNNNSEGEGSSAAGGEQATDRLSEGLSAEVLSSGPGPDDFDPDEGPDSSNSPIYIPKDATRVVQQKDGYTQVKYTWRSDGYRFEARWHTRTPGAPEGTGPSWVVTRTTPGTQFGARKTTHVLTKVNSTTNRWVTRAEWQRAISARQAGTATPAQRGLLDSGHFR